MPTDTKFTANSIEELPPAPPGGREWYRDAKRQGLLLCVTDSGRKSWYVRGRIAGLKDEKGNPAQPRKVHLGTYGDLPGDLSPKAAEEQARECLALMRQGIDPVVKAEKEQRQAAVERKEAQARDRFTFGHVFEHFLEDGRSSAKGATQPKRRTWREDERRYKKHLQALKPQPLDEIESREVAEIHTRVTRKHGPYEANRVLALASSVVSHAKHAMGWRGENPAEGVKKNPEKKRDRRLTAAEQVKFLKTIEGFREDGSVREVVLDALLVAYHTGQRIGATRKMRWDGIDFAAKTWTTREEDFKGKREHVVPLSSEALAVLRRRRTAAPPEAEYVFPACRVRTLKGMPESDQPRPVGPCEINYGEWEKVRDAAGLKGFKIHDLRHTFTSVLGEAGVPVPVLQRLLGHRSIQTTMRYVHVESESLREAVNLSGRLLAARSA